MLLALAPMKDVTDLAFLNTLKDLNSLPDYFITEYFRTVAHHKKMSPYILRSIDENPTGRPIYGQLVGHEPEYLARDAQALMEHACAGVDLNMGCPAPIVCRRNAGGRHAAVPEGHGCGPGSAPGRTACRSLYR